MASKTHVVLPGSKRARNSASTRISDVDPKEKISVTIGLVGPKLPTANEYIGRTLSTSELEEKFSSSKEDAAKVAKSLKKFGLRVDEVSLGTRSMRVSGTAAAMEAAFKPGLAMLSDPRQGEYRGREGTIMIPKELKGIVTGVFGLDQRQMARRKAHSHSASLPSATSGQAGLSPLAPTDLETRYNFPAGDGSGQHIAIAEFGGGYFNADTLAYCTKFNRPAPNVQGVAVDAPAYTLQQILALPPLQRKNELDASVEVMMDAEIIAGLCPKANVTVYFSTFDQRGWVDLLNKVIADKPVCLSISWGLAEDDPSWSSNATAAINDRLNALRLLGITTCVSSGDDGSGDQLTDGRAHVNFPASSPFVLSVGGTMLTGSGKAIKEVVWWDTPGRRTPKGGGSTGGGVSTIFQRPTWQGVRVASLNPKSIDGRVMPDVSALAGEPLYDLIFAGQPQPNGGTSASAPLWAALVARVNANLAVGKKQRFLTPLLYQNGPNGTTIGKSVTRDISSGNNASHPSPGKGYKAAAGFDAVSGWGVPDGQKLLALLSTV